MTVARAAADAARAIRRTPPVVVRESAGQIRKDLLREAGQAVGSDLRMRNLRSVRLGVKVEVVRWGQGALADVVPSTNRAKAPWRWLEDGTRAHVVPRRGRQSRMTVGGAVLVGPWEVRGVRPKRSWSKARPGPAAVKAGREAFDGVIRRG